MRGEIVPPSKLIVKTNLRPREGFLIRWGFLLRGGDYSYGLRQGGSDEVVLPER